MKERASRLDDRDEQDIYKGKDRKPENIRNLRSELENRHGKVFDVPIYNAEGDFIIANFNPKSETVDLTGSKGEKSLPIEEFEHELLEYHFSDPPRTEQSSGLESKPIEVVAEVETEPVSTNKPESLEEMTKKLAAANDAAMARAEAEDETARRQDLINAAKSDLEEAQREIPNKAPENKKEEKKLTNQEFEEKYGHLKHRFFYGSPNDKENFININSYDEETGKAIVALSVLIDGKSKQKIHEHTISKLDELIRRHPVKGEVKKIDLNAEDLENLRNETRDNKNKETAIENTENIEDEKIRELREKLDLARTSYIKSDNAVKEKLSLFNKLKIIVSGEGAENKLGEFNQEFLDAKAKYNNALIDYKNLLMETRVDDKEGAFIMADFLNKREFANIQSIKEQVRIEKSPWYGTEKIKNGYIGLLERYRSLPLKKKLIIGAGLGVIGAASGMWAGAAVAGSVMVARRAFSISISSLGFKQMMEVKAEKEKNRETSQFVSNLENEKGEVDFERFSNLLDQEIAGIGEEMKKREFENNFRTAKAIVYGTIFSFIAGKLGNEIAKSETMKTAVEFWKDKFGILPEGVINSTENIHNNGAVTAATASNLEGIKAGVEKLIDLDAIKTGGSIEGSIKDYLEGNPNLIEKYNELNGGRNFDAGDIAHRMFLEYGDQRDLVHAGAQIHLSPDGLHIESITGDDNMDYLPKDAVETVPEAGSDVGATHEEVANKAESSGEGLQQGHWKPRETFIPEAEAFSGNEYESYMQERSELEKIIGQRSDIYGHYPDLMNADLDAEYSKLDKLLAFEKVGHEGIGSVPMENTIEGQKHIDLINDKMKAITELKQLRLNYADAYKKAMFSFGTMDSNIANMNAQEYVKEHSSDKAVKIFKGLKASMGPEQVKHLKLDPSSGEDTFSWSKRVVNAMLNNLSKK